MTNDFNIEPLEAGEPSAHRTGGIKGGSKRTLFYREQLQSNPGKWFIWKKNGKYASDTSGALRTLTGLSSISGVDRNSLAYKATAQRQDDGTYTTFVQYVGDDDTVDFEFTANVDQTDEATADVVSNPFGIN